MNTLCRVTSNMLVLFTVLLSIASVVCFFQSDYPLFSWVSMLAVSCAVWAKFLHLRYLQFQARLMEKTETTTQAHPFRDESEDHKWQAHEETP
jgi:hypothetical protein